MVKSLFTLHSERQPALFLLTCSLATLLLLGTLVRILFPYENNNSQKLTKLIEEKELIEAISVGHSHARSIHFSAMEINGMHFFDSGGDLIFGIEKAKNLLDTLPNLKFVFVPVSEASLFYRASQATLGRNNMHAIFDNMPDSSVLMPMAPKAYIDYLFFRKLINLDEVRSRFRLAVRDIVLTMATKSNVETLSECNEPKYTGEFIDGLPNGYITSSNSNSCLKKNAIQTKAFFDNALRNTKKPELNKKVAIAELEKLSTILKSKNIDLVLVQTPVTSYFRESMAIHDDLSTIELSSVLRRNAIIINTSDFFKDEKATEVFFDSHHLNKRGAIEYSLYLRSLLDNNRYSQD